MASYFSGISNALSNTTSKVRQNLLSSENDGSTVYETATCRALRSYYAEKQRPWPGTYDANRDHETRKGRDIYDPDAIKPAAAPIQAVMAPPSNYGGGYQPANRYPWEQSGQQAPPPQQQGSLRAGRAQVGRAGSSNSYQKGPPPAEIIPQPLPSDRAQSYQNANANAYSSQPAAPAYMSAKDKLKFGKFGKPNQRSDSPSSNSGMGSRGNSFTSSQGNSGYEDSSRPGNYGRSSGGNDKPFVAATAPWASSADEFSGGGYGGGGYDTGSAGRSAGARGPGLPSGPRGRRN